MPSDPPDAGAPDQDEDAASDDSGNAECIDGEQEVCSCSDTEYGKRTCSSGEFGDCEDCEAAVRDEALCVAGVYKGRTTGSYRSSASSLWGLTPGMTGSIDAEWTFELVRDGDGEFYSVKGACVPPPPGEEKWGGKDDTAYGNTLEMLGTVDCTTGVIDFEVRLEYLASNWDSFGGWARYFAKGKMTGRYDPKTRSFVDGKWDLREKGTGFGGQGSFTGALSEEATAPSTPQACFDLPFPSDLTPQPIPNPT
ncbi:MAG: hypothetical protein QM778_38775 [Myxococcales bacterium]